MFLATSISVLMLVMSFGYVGHLTTVSLLSGHLVPVSGICLHCLPVQLDFISSLPPCGREFVVFDSALCFYSLSADCGKFSGHSRNIICRLTLSAEKEHRQIIVSDAPLFTTNSTCSSHLIQLSCRWFTKTSKYCSIP